MELYEENFQAPSRSERRTRTGFSTAVPSMTWEFSFFPIFTLALLLSLHQLWKLCVAMWRKPRKAIRILASQGINALPFRFFHGNSPEFRALNLRARLSTLPSLSHDILPRVLPHYHLWRTDYGRIFAYSLGYSPRLSIADPDLAKEILHNKSGHFSGRALLGPEAKDVLGDGLAILDGEKWAQHRRIVSPAFFVEKLKRMTPTIAGLVVKMVEEWEAQIEGDGRNEIEVHKEFKMLTADVIAHTAFGSSYAEGKLVFELQDEQLTLLLQILQSSYFPGRSILPTATNRRRWSLQNRVRNVLVQIIEKRFKSAKTGKEDLYGKDLLGMMMDASRKELVGERTGSTMGMEDIIDECKTFFFAGHETTANLLTWTLMLLASNQQWQERARAEVLSAFGPAARPDGDSLSHLKIMSMVLNESLRLYPSAAVVARQTRGDAVLHNGLLIPDGVMLSIELLGMHHDEELWGADVNEFRPERFAEGTPDGRRHPMAFIPFSAGPRNCVGQNFALMEAKVVLSIVLQRFTFRMSPNYRHAPILKGTIQPQYGMPIILERLPPQVKAFSGLTSNPAYNPSI